MASRTTEFVFDARSQRGKAEDLEADLVRNQAPDVVPLTGSGAFGGRHGVRASADDPGYGVSNADRDDRVLVAKGDAAFRLRQAPSVTTLVADGAEALPIRDRGSADRMIRYSVIPNTPMAEPVTAKTVLEGAVLGHGAAPAAREAILLHSRARTRNARNAKRGGRP